MRWLRSPATRAGDQTTFNNDLGLNWSAHRVATVFGTALVLALNPLSEEASADRIRHTLRQVHLTFVRPHNSIDGPVCTGEVADFIVLSGQNGSGKTNLLEAIQQGALTIDGVTGHPELPTPPRVRLFSLAQLVAAAEGAQTAAGYRDRWVAPYQATQQLIAQLQGHPNNLTAGSEELEAGLHTNLRNTRQMTPSAINRMVNEANKRLIDFTVDDFRKYSPLIVGIRDPFSMTVGELFLSYHQRRERNAFYQWRQEKNQATDYVPLTDDEFVIKFGPEPCDLLNDTLALVGLDYRFDPPQGGEEDLMYEPQLTHAGGALVKMAQLSSGEKTLMAIAMSLYTGSRLGEAIELPEVLLLDESDASLHPSMVQSLLRVADDIFCKRYGVKVILTTHSPSTVALAPEEALYTMCRSGNPRLQRATRDDALASLLVGLPTLSVRVENRRQVFVESERDQACYQELFRLLRQQVDSQFSLEFIASGRGGQGNCEAVKHLVTSLRDSGNAVYGVVDRDDRGGAPEGIIFLPTRRALENLVLDPLPVAVFLLREGIMSAEEMLGVDVRHYEMSKQHAQAACDFVVGRIRESKDDNTAVTMSYLGGFAVSVPRFYLDIDGHLLEKRLMAAFPALNKHGANLKLTVIARGLADVPGYTPDDVLQLFAQLVK